MIRRAARVIALVAAALPASMGALRAQDSPQVVHATRVFELIRQERFDDVVKEFNARTTEELSAAQLAAVWTTLKQQTGPFVSIVKQEATPMGDGITLVLLNYRFERFVLGFAIGFEADGKIAGLKLLPPPPGAVTAPP